MRMRPHRGSALLVAVLLVAVLAIVGIALINRTTAEMDAVGAKRKYDQTVSCAEAGRQMVFSQFRVFGTDPSTIRVDTVTNGLRVATGHYDQFGIASVTPVPGAAQTTANAVTGLKVGGDMGNRMGGLAGSGGQPWRVVVVCTDSSNQHQQEVEFDVRFGI